MELKQEIWETVELIKSFFLASSTPQDVTAQVDVPLPSLSKPRTKEKFSLPLVGTDVSSHRAMLVLQKSEPVPEYLSHLTAFTFGLHHPCGPLPTLNILWF